jgi:hypothetical protein
MRCQHCDTNFEARTVRRRFCSDKCRKAAWQAKRAHTLARLQENLSHALAQVQAIRERRTRPGGPMPTGGRSGSWSRPQSADE